LRTLIAYHGQGGETAPNGRRDDRLPVFALTVFAKNERANLTAAERNAMAAIARAIKQQLER